MIIEIDDDCVDEIIKSALAKDYAHLTNDLKINKKHPGHLHDDDAQAFQETVDAIKVLSNWYFIKGEFDAAVKKVKKK